MMKRSPPAGVDGAERLLQGDFPEAHLQPTPTEVKEQRRKNPLENPEDSSYDELSSRIHPSKGIRGG
jgi:hypothetical protein